MLFRLMHESSQECKEQFWLLEESDPAGGVNEPIMRKGDEMSLTSLSCINIDSDHSEGIDLFSWK